MHAQTEKTVDSIRIRYNDIVEKARLCETDDDRGEYGDLVMNTLEVNARHHQWRAVGVYGQVFKFFYKGGDSEEHLYPDQLVLVKVERRVSARTYNEEYMFSDAGVLMFYFQKAEGDDQLPGERRVYFFGGKAFRVIEDGKTRDRLNAKDLANVKEIASSATKLKTMFKTSISF